MLKSISAALLALGLCACSASSQAPATAAAACIDASKIKKDAVCTMDYAPVCGCDGKTYSNACVATNAGVTAFTKGECPAAPTH